MPIHLLQPYKIIPSKEKRYIAHYNIPAGQCVVVPVRDFGDEVLCELRWEDANGVLHLLENKMFVADNLMPLNPLLDLKLHEVWSHYYGAQAAAASERKG